MDENWKGQMARNLDRELDIKGVSGERAKLVFRKRRDEVFKWFEATAEEIRKLSDNPQAIGIISEGNELSVTIGSIALRLKAKPFPLSSRGWGEILISVSGTMNELPFDSLVLRRQGREFNWVYEPPDEFTEGRPRWSQDVGWWDRTAEVTPDDIDRLFRSVFSKYLD